MWRLTRCSDARLHVSVSYSDIVPRGGATDTVASGKSTDLNCAMNFVMRCRSSTWLCFPALRIAQHRRRRMYWAKQVIGWTPDAQTALKYCMRLNNRWELDAVDPNSYAGVIWNFGRHDQGWKERPVWGKVRYMNDAGLKRKFNMAAYIAKVDQLVKQHGLPPHIGDLVARSKKRKGAQLTMDQMGTHGVKGRAALPKKRRT